MAGTAVFEWKIGKLCEKSPKESTKNTRNANGCQQKFKVSLYHYYNTLTLLTFYLIGSKNCSKQMKKWLQR